MTLMSQVDPLEVDHEQVPLPQAQDLAALEDYEDDDIYRGEPHRSNSHSPASSSSGSILATGRLGTIAAVVELAVTRWARAKSSASSTSSSPKSSINTVSRSHMSRRRRRPPSSNDLRSVLSERDITARLKARQESRQVAREFTLYLPPSPDSSSPSTALNIGIKPQGDSQNVFRTTCLPLLLNQLEVTLKNPKARRNHDVARLQSSHVSPSDPPMPHLHYMLPDHVKVPSRPASFADLSSFRNTRKGKERGQLHDDATKTQMLGKNLKAHRAWWLDVASPTWEDMRAVGKLLHLHPLTLEDILQQEPREKLEVFPRLGYYLIVFRAIESQTTRGRFLRHTNKDANTGKLKDEGVIGEANVYLVVFREGICSFHFTDISEHTDRVRNRILLLEALMNVSSDWIAHGILDSIVDSFFPFVEEVEREVVAIEDIVFSDGQNARRQSDATTDIIPNVGSAQTVEKDVDEEKVDSVVCETHVSPTSRVYQGKAHFATPRLTISLFFRRLRRSIKGAFRDHSPVDAESKSSIGTTSTLWRMARTRRLVTSLTRLLATKSEVVMQIRKRLLNASQPGLGIASEKTDDIEVAIYMGDVQDHILTLQHSLAHYERMLSQSHPVYLSQLSTTVHSTKSSTDKGIMVLTVVSISVLCIQTLIGLFSMNIQLPRNGREQGYPYNVFGIVLALSTVVLLAYVSAVQRWWKLAKKRARF